MKGYVWYCEKIYSGTEEEYWKFCDQNDHVELVMTLYDTTGEKLKTIANSLNNSNFLDHLNNRTKK